MKKIVNGIKANDYFGAGLTDEKVMFGLPSFAEEMEELKKPYILGMNVQVDTIYLSLFVLNDIGYHNLLNINTAIQNETLTMDVLKNNSVGLAAVIETKYGDFKTKYLSITKETVTTFTRYLNTISSIYGDNFYLGNEVTCKEDVKYANSIRKFAQQYTYKCIAFPRIKYLKKEDAIVLKIVKAIDDGEKEFKEKKADGQEYFMKNEDYAKIYNSEEIDNTNKLIESAHFNINEKRGEILHYQTENSEEELKSLCNKGLTNKGLDKDERYIKQLGHELDVIISMGYADYFLLVHDYVTWAKNNDILVGPGRGSAAGSLVSYLLDITEIDPIKYNLQFERFLNPNRKTMPDIDVDFMDTRRDEVVQYMRDKYGAHKVANIVAFQTIKARQSLRDVGKIYGYPERHISLLTKAISNQKYTLGQAYKNLPEFKNLVDSDEYFKEFVSLAAKIEGLPRQSGQHAAGVVFSNVSMEKALPVTIDFNDNYISQYEAKYLEKQNFLKMDFLGLRNLTTIVLCVYFINKNHPEAKLSNNNIPYDSPEIFELINSLQTMGLFQIETTTMKRGISILKPSCFEDVVALLALNRPGPMAFIENYANRRDGKEKFTYLSDALKDILAPTYGIIVYQEQINQIATVMAGFTPGEADMFRRAISKKQTDIMASMEKQFIEGSIKQGYSEKESKQVYNHILKFADYGFNRSHSVVYAVIACRMAWLKAHYPLEFYSAILQTGSSTSDSKFTEYLTEMKGRGLKVLPPSINHSEITFIIKDNALLFPLGSISGINDLFVQSVIKERENGYFKDFFDFVTRMYQYKISESQISKLIDSGALDELYPSRESMRSSIRNALQFAELNYSPDGQLSLGLAAMIAPSMPEEHDDPLDNLDKENEVLGIMLSSNPLEYKHDLIAAKGAIKISEIPSRGKCTIVGIVKMKKIIKTKKGGSMAFVKVYDETSELEITVFPSLFETVNSITNRNNIIVVKGRYDGKGVDISFVADEIELLED